MYKVTLFPFLGKRRYSDGVDITRYIEKNGLKKINQTIDSSDFSTQQSYNSIKLKLINHENIFSIDSIRSIFFSRVRDNSIIRISFINGDSETVAFEGRISDEGTYEDEAKKTIRFTVVSFESGFNKIIVKNPKVFGEDINGKKTQ